MQNIHGAAFVVVCHLIFSGDTQAALPRIVVAADQAGFCEADTQRPFVPFGFNYDHDENGRLLEDYWFTEWSKVEADFAEMKALGANVVRIHLQLARFMESPSQSNPKSLEQLHRLTILAERTGLYLDVTGLGCYHKPDVPAWYDALSESERWQTQVNFWKSVAKSIGNSSAVFCYDLMNEPVVPGGKRAPNDWLGPAFAGKHFVQFITLDTHGRERTEIARQWTDKLVAAIRNEDPHHLITVGMVPWSLDRPGLTSGFVPSEVAGSLDFLAVHLYPETGKVEEAIETLRGFAIGKPVIIEETFPLKCNLDDFDSFMGKSKRFANGWIGFYWGKTIDDYTPPQTIPDAMTLGWLNWFVREAKTYKDR